MKSSNTSKRLKEFMEKNNLRQVDLLRLAKPYCQLYGVKLNKSDLSQYVSGKVEPGQDKLFILAKALNVSEAWLMGFDSESQKATPVYFNNKPIKDISELSSEDLQKITKKLTYVTEDVITKLKEFDEVILNSQSERIETIIHYYSTLNHEGKKELLKRAVELNQIKKYTKTDDK